MKGTILSIAALCVLGLASCKKDYTCECTYQGTGDITVTEKHDIKNAALDDAKDKCDDYEDNTTFSKTCTLL